MVVREGFEPSKAEPADLQSAPFGRSGPSPHSFKWCRLSDSNQPPADYKSAALPDELKRQINLTVKIKLAEVTRLELATSCVTGKHSNQLSYTSKNGGHNWARTSDPLLVRQVLSQLSYATIFNKTIKS